MSPPEDRSCLLLSNFAKAWWEGSPLPLSVWAGCHFCLWSSEAWEHCNFLMVIFTIDLDFLEHFSFFLLEIYVCVWHLPHPLWTLRQRTYLIFFFFLASSGGKFPLPFLWPLWPLVPYVVKNVLFVSSSYVIYHVFILNLCLSDHFLHSPDFPQ